MVDSLIKIKSGMIQSPDCQYNEIHMQTLIDATNNVAGEIKISSTGVATEIRELGNQITILNSHHKDIIRYLMIVVCVIALGKSLLEAAQSFWFHTPQAVSQNK